jgi:hypothetical protein
MNFQENPYNGRNACTGTRNTAKGHCSASNANLIIYRSQGNFYSFWCVSDECEVWIFRKIPQMEPWYSQEGTLPSKQGTLIVDWLEVVSHHIYHIREWRNLWIFRVIPPVEAELQPRMNNALQVNVPWFLGDCTQMCTISISCVVNASNGFSEKSLQWKPSISQKSSYFT